MAWLKGTEWNWNNNEFSVKLTTDLEAEAPINQCQRTPCKWSAENGKLYLLLGQAGVAEFSTEAQKPADMKGLRMKGKLRSSGERITLTFNKIFDHGAVDLDKDLYGALGLPDDADDAAIKKAYRKLSIQYHPDKNPDEASRAKFNDIRDAYEILNDPDKKVLYDTGGMSAVQKLEKGEVEKTDDFEASFDVTLEELYNGETKQVQVNRRIVCRGCRLHPNAPQCAGCGRCPNEVKLVKVQMGPFLTQQQQEVPSKEKCKKEDAQIEVNIEKGMKAGDKVDFPRMADQRPGMLPGNLILKLNAKEHSKFKRRGDNLHMDMTVSLREALLGFEQTVRHLDGHVVTITLDQVIKEHQVVVVKGEGMPFRDDPASFGDLHVRVSVKFPSSLTQSQKEAVEKAFAPTPPRQEL
jgi:DnaJ-class molecular chaperone